MANFLKKMKIFGNFFEKNVKFFTIFDIQMAICRRVSCECFPFVQARDVFEEAIQTVVTVRDFTQVFDACAQFEKTMFSSKMETIEEDGASEEGEKLKKKLFPFSSFRFSIYSSNV